MDDDDMDGRAIKSIPAIHASKALRVGLPEREYSKPYITLI
jgi:hypothetical protein